ncbi:RNA polymerase sigma factor [Nocardia salmonicida]|uniref:RNA polymerase sigma factor n=1 Tax=Nocardia salmonicida TaxID=53431 RepID=UPI0033D537EC
MSGNEPLAASDQTPPRAGESGAGGSAESKAWTNFTKFHAEYRPRLLRFVYRLASTYELAESALDAEGVVQETFEQALRSWDRIDSPERWIFVVARRTIARQARSHYAEEEALREKIRRVRRTRAHSDPVHAQAVERMIVERIMDLPLNQQAATYLHHVEGWTGAEIAELLGIATSTAGVHIHRGTARVSGTIAGRANVNNVQVNNLYVQRQRRLLPALLWGLLFVVLSAVVFAFEVLGLSVVLTSGLATLGILALGATGIAIYRWWTER